MGNNMKKNNKSIFCDIAFASVKPLVDLLKLKIQATKGVNNGTISSEKTIKCLSAV